MICDVCSRGEAAFTHAATPFTAHQVVNGIERTSVYDATSYDLCTICTDLVRTGSLDALAQRAAVKVLEAEDDPEDWLTEFALGMVRLVVDHFTGEVSPLPLEAA